MKPTDDKPPAQRGSHAARVYNAGVRTPRHISNMTLGGIGDILNGTLGNKEAATIFRGIGELRKSVEVGEKIGQNKDVVDPSPPPSDPLAAEEECLKAKLEALRAQRAAKNGD